MRDHPFLLKYALIPFLINVLVFGLAVYLSWHYGEVFLNQVIPKGEAWYWALLFYLSLGLLGFLLILLAIFTFTVVGALIAGPFNEALSEKTEEILVGRVSESADPDRGSLFNFFRLLRRTSFSLFESLKEVSFFALIGLCTFFFNFIPGLGTALNTLWIWIFLAFEFLSYPLSRRDYSFRQKRQIVWRHLSLALGFGLGVFLILLIPLLNFVCIPVSVVGGTLLYVREIGGARGD